MVYRLVCIYFVLVTFVFANEKNVLLIHSFSKGTNWADNVSAGVESVFDGDSNINLSTEYINIEKHTDAKYFDLLHDFYVKRFSKTKYDVVIVSDHFAVEFVMKYKDDFFHDVAFIFCGLEKNIKKYTKKYKNKNINLVLESVRHKRNFALAKELFPELKLLYFIDDKSYSNKIYNPVKDAAILSFQDSVIIEKESVTNLQNILSRINNLPKDSAVMIGNFTINDKNKIITNYEKEIFFKSIDKPIFILSDEQINDHVLGGYLLSGFEQGRTSAELAYKRLKGKRASDLPLITIPDTVPIFNYKMMKKYNIDKYKLANNVQIINEPKSFIEQNQKFVTIALIMLPVIILLMSFSILNIILRKRAEKKLAIQHNFDEVLLDNVNKIVFWCNSEKKVLGCNNAFCELTNEVEKNILGKNVDCFLPKLYEKIISTPHNNELELLHEINKKSYWFFIKQLNFRFNLENHGLVIIMQDITEDKKEAEEKRRTELFLIQQSKQAEVGEMVTAIAHQWKSPLLEISTLTQKMSLWYKKDQIDENKVNTFVDSIMNHVVYMGETIDDFRSFIRPSSKKTSFDLIETTTKAMRIINQTLIFHYIESEMVNTTNKDIFIYGYCNEFKQIIINIINNAKDSIIASREKGHECGNIKVQIGIDNKKILISIIDDGAGFSDEALIKAFEPFYSTKRKNDGDGLGLYMSKLIIEDKMGGNIFIKNEDKGANVSISIDLYDI